MNNLISHINRYTKISSTQEELILSRVKVLKLQKKEHIELENTIHRNIYFVEEGCLHLYEITEKGNEQTIQFAIKDWWLTDYDSFSNEISSKYSIQAVKESSLIAISKTNFDYLLSEITELERYFRIILQRAYTASLSRISLMFQYSKEERYLNFVNKYAKFTQDIPQYVIGSFLGISAEYISEIRKKQTK